jgi:hypothetical protein
MDTYEVDAGGARVKRRDVGTVALLTVFTLGIYAFVWYFRINRELRDFGAAQGDEDLAGERPGLSLLAVTLGWLVIVPAIVSYYRCTKRIKRAQALGEVPEEHVTSGTVIFWLCVGGLLTAVGFVGVPTYVQIGLNHVWDQYPRLEEPPEQLAAP